MSSLTLRLLPMVPVLALSFAAVGCHQTPGSTMRVQTNSAAASNVARYRTYSHETADKAPRGYATTAMTAGTLDKVRADIDMEMQKRGYVHAETGGDLTVRISAGVRVVDDQPTGGAAQAGAPSDQDRIGALVVDIFDRENSGHLFHGYARDELHTDSATDAQIRSAVTKILAPLPAAGDLH